ncbi:MAG: hypothetical protein R6X31_02145 [Anaerolineae bacterium]
MYEQWPDRFLSSSGLNVTHLLTMFSSFLLAHQLLAVNRGIRILGQCEWGKDPVVFGYVNKEKAREIIDVYIKRGELIDGVIPITFKTIDE